MSHIEQLHSLKDFAPYQASIDRNVDGTATKIESMKLGPLFETCFYDAIAKALTYNLDGKNYTFIRTGSNLSNKALWLRDSAIQSLPYVRFTGEDSRLNGFIQGIINQQAAFILRDPYANAHMLNPDDKTPHKYDKTDMKPGVFERKWEPDSLAYFLFLSHRYYQASGNADFFKDKDWQEAAGLSVNTFITEQRLDGKTHYDFQKGGWTKFLPTERIRNLPTNKIGLVHGTHRPSDDSTYFLFNIPVNLFISSALNGLSEIYSKALKNEQLASQAKRLSSQIANAAFEYGVTEFGDYGKILSYETDGFGNFLFMDDANIPGLLSLPFLGSIDENSEIFQSTRKFVLSSDNPHFYKGRVYEGIGSPHTYRNRPWHTGMIMAAITASGSELESRIQMLHLSVGSNGRFAESVSLDNPGNLTRPDFGMANSLYAELMLRQKIA